MNKIKNKDKFDFKEVPDIFLLNEKGEIIYCIDTIKSFEAKFQGYGKWIIKVTSSIFHKNISSLWTNYNQHYDIYCRTFKRNLETRKDSDFCFKFENAILKTISINADSDGEPCNFPIVFMSDNMIFINNEECPKLVLSESEVKEMFYPIKD